MGEFSAGDIVSVKHPEWSGWTIGTVKKRTGKGYINERERDMKKRTGKGYMYTVAGYGTEALFGKHGAPFQFTREMLLPAVDPAKLRGEMSVTAYMHKSITSKLSLKKRSTLTKWAVKGATKPETWWGKAIGATVGSLASALFAVPTALSAAGEKLIDTCANKNIKEPKTITFYWKGNDLWCRLPQRTCSRKFIHSHNSKWLRENSDYYQETKVEGIDGHFDDQELVIRFTKTRGNQTAVDRVIDISSDHTNLRKTLMWIRDNQGDRKYLDRSVQQILECKEDKFLQCLICHGEGTVPCQQSECMNTRRIGVHPCEEECKKVCRACGGINFTSYNVV